jgi:predicted MFS family arabinose efflux permease
MTVQRQAGRADVLGMGKVRGRLATLCGGLREPAFRRLWLSQVVSEIGDWGARLALTTLVYHRTGSAAWATLIAVSGLLPMLGPGQLLATLADRLDRRLILVGADVVRAAVFAVLTVTTPPTGMLLALSTLAGLATVPFEAARSAATVDVTPPDRLPAAMALGQATQSLALVLGWALGGVLLLVAGTHGALGVNAGTFMASAVLLAGLPALRPSRRAQDAETRDRRRGPVRRLTGAARWVLREPLVRRATIVAVLAVGPATAVEALVVPYVGSASDSQSLAALLLALGAVGDLLLTVAIPTELPPEKLLRIAAWCSAGPAAVAALLFGTGNNALISAGFVVSAMSLSAIAPASSALAPRLPAHLRASCFTVLATALTLTQVVLSTGGGVAADSLEPQWAALGLALMPVVAGVAALCRPARSASAAPMPAVPTPVEAAS